jgi:hypothetical protein
MKFIISNLIRNKVLANENKTLKDQVKTLLDKGKLIRFSTERLSFE